MNKHLLIWGLLLSLMLFPTLNHRANAQERDSLTYTNIPTPKPITWVDRAPLQTTLGTMVPLALFDLSFFKQDKSIRNIREQYIPRYNNKIENIILPLPLATTWGLRLAGVEGRSESHLEALSAQTLSIGLSLGVTKASKLITKRQRPIGVPNDYSFPSMHSATAFSLAAILDAEYGAQYPWISAIGYGVAGSVGLSRIANNRHWATDVVTGAGVGIVSTYIGYLLNDLLWGRGVERFRIDCERDNHQSPILLTVSNGFSTLLSSSSDYKASSLGNNVALRLRFPLYQEWGVRFSGALISSHNQLSPKEYLHGYDLQVGTDYMHGFWQGRLWLDGNISLGYISEMRLSTGIQKRSESIPFIAPGVLARVGAGATLLTSNHFAVQIDAGMTTAPLSRPYSRDTKKGLRGLDFGIGMTYVIN